MKFSSHVLLTGVLTACPFGSPRSSCIFNTIRESPLSERVNWLSSLPEDERVGLAEAHKRCSARREHELRS